jgi:basic membrane protein A
MSKRVLLITAMVLVMVMVAMTMIGCGQKPPEPAKQEPPKQQQEQPKKIRVGAIYSVPNPARAGGWDRAQFAGLQVLQDQYGWEVVIAEAVPFPQLAETAAGYADKGFDIVIFTSSAHLAAMKEVAPKYPNTRFLLMSVATELPDLPNVGAFSPNMYVYGNLVGIVGAKASKSGVIGAVGGMPIPVLETLFSGIIEGARAVRPESKVLVSWAGDWVDLAKHREVTLLQAQDKADIFFTVTGPGTMGVFEAAESRNALAIGYAADWYNDAPKTVLTSVLVDVEKMYKEMAEAFKAGTLTNKVVNLDAAYFKLADFRGKLSADVEKDIRDTVAKVQRGELKIPVKMHPDIMKK